MHHLVFFFGCPPRRIGLEERDPVSVWQAERCGHMVDSNLGPRIVDRDRLAILVGRVLFGPGSATHVRAQSSGREDELDRTPHCYWLGHREIIEHAVLRSEAPRHKPRMRCTSNRDICDFKRFGVRSDRHRRQRHWHAWSARCGQFQVPSIGKFVCPGCHVQVRIGRSNISRPVHRNSQSRLQLRVRAARSTDNQNRAARRSKL